MTRRALGAFLGLAAALAIPAASGAASTGRTQLRIAPRTPRPSSTIVISFRQPTAGGLLPGVRMRQTLSVAGPSRPGCISDVVRAVGTPAAGTPIRVTLRPSRMTPGRWCVGVYRVALVQTREQACPIGPQRRICPQFVPAPSVVATARFRVTRAPTG